MKEVYNDWFSTLKIWQFVDIVWRTGTINQKIIIFDEEDDVEEYVKIYPDVSDFGGAIFATHTSDMRAAYIFSDRVNNMIIKRVYALDRDTFAVYAVKSDE